MGRISDRLKGRIGGWAGRYRRAMEDLAGTLSLPTSEHDRRALVEAGCDPLCTSYLAVQGVVSLFAACVSSQPEMQAYCEAVSQAEDRYTPDGPPTSPLTPSYFSAWSLFDLSFGPQRETVGTCLVDLGDTLAIDPAIVEAVDRLARSRMGVYEHRGACDGRIVLGELVAGREWTCACPWGYMGSQGELWFVRLAEPLDGIGHDRFVVTTPYVLTGMGKADWVAYLHRTMLQLDPAWSRAERLGHLLKFGLSPWHWHDFIVQAFDRCRGDAVFLCGLPDVHGSMPRSTGNRGICRF